MRVSTPRIRLTGLGQPGASAATPDTTSACGPYPCGEFDWIWTSDACAKWLACAGQPAVTFGNVLGAGAQSIASGGAEVVASAATGAASGVASGVTNNLSFGGGALMLGALGVGVLVLVLVLKR